MMRCIDKALESRLSLRHGFKPLLRRHPQCRERRGLLIRDGAALVGTDYATGGIDEIEVILEIERNIAG